MTKDANEHDKLQIEMAARGCVSGRLGEWPMLKSALRKYGYGNLSNFTRADVLRKLCQDILLAEEASNERE